MEELRLHCNQVSKSSVILYKLMVRYLRFCLRIGPMYSNRTKNDKHTNSSRFSKRVQSEGSDLKLLLAMDKYRKDVSLKRDCGITDSLF